MSNSSSISSEKSNEEEECKGTLFSARLNLLSSMVGGGSLSLPLAFSEVGIGFSGPILVIFSCFAADFTVRALIESSRHQNSFSYDSLVSSVFGDKMQSICRVMVFSLCFMTVIGYAIILRDLGQPLAHLIKEDSKVISNGLMLLIIFILTPLCCQRTLTSLQNVGMASMISVFIMGACVSYRSIQCNLFTGENQIPFWEYITLTSFSIRSFLNAFPLIVSIFVCHFNVIPIYNELDNPTPKRVRNLVHSTMIIACFFYITVGFWGAMHGNCSGQVSGNILLDFGESDPLLLIARTCLAITICCMCPMLVTPARNILLELCDCYILSSQPDSLKQNDILFDSDLEVYNNLTKPLLQETESTQSSLFFSALSPSADSLSLDDLSYEEDVQIPSIRKHYAIGKLKFRFFTAIVIFWGAAIVGCFIQDLETIYDLLGSSFSILIGYLIPCFLYIVIRRATEKKVDSSIIVSIILLLVFVPSFFLCTINSVYNIFE